MKKYISASVKLTPKQNELITQYQKLIEEYGDNVFLRYVNDFYGYCFILHKKGSRTYEILQKKVNGRVITGLQRLNVFVPIDKNHMPGKDANDLKYAEDNWFVGSRLDLEKL